MTIPAPDRSRWRRRYLLPAVVAAMAVGATATWAYADEPEPAGYSLFTGVDTGAARPDPDRNEVEVGVRFTADEAGTVTAVRFLKAPGDRPTHQVTVWAEDGRQLATTRSSGETASGVLYMLCGCRHW